jgi:DNA modification methylase
MKVVSFQTGGGASGKPSSLSAGRDTEYKNIHPTVKPTDLMKYLCRLVTPKNGIVLDPFMGSGSTGKAAAQEGFKFIGIEMSSEYFEIAEARVKHAYDGKTISLEEFFS